MAKQVNRLRQSKRDAITLEEALQLLGLKKLAQQHNRALQEIVHAAAVITQELDSHGQLDGTGHTSDFIYCDNDSLRELLDKLGLSIEQSNHDLAAVLAALS